MLFYDDLRSFVSGQREKLENLPNANIPEQGLILKVLGPAEDQDRRSNVAEYSITRETDGLEIDYRGIFGDRHRRSNRASTSREKSTYPKGTTIREHRHVFAVSLYDCEVLSEALGVAVTPEVLGANLLIEREDRKDYSLSHLPLGTNLLVSADLGSSESPKPPLATLVHHVQQQGCGVTGNTIARRYQDRSLTKRFMESSKNNRGIVLSVEYPVDNSAILKVGQKVFFRFPMGVAP